MRLTEKIYTTMTDGCNNMRLTQNYIQQWQTVCNNMRLTERIYTTMTDGL